jgi:hypothetical protein
MRKKVVVMPLIPGRTERSSTLRADLRYAAYGRATWEWWCRRNGAEFVVLDRPLGSGVFEEMSPSMKRWLAPQALIETYGGDAQIAMVDADTMIRWDAPSLFDAAGAGFAAVLDTGPRWIHHEIQAYQHLFPGVQLTWWEYFNAGVVVFGARQLTTIAAFLDFVAAHWRELRTLHADGRLSVDQTLVNFMAKRQREAITFMPPPFNLIRCVSMTPLLWACENGTSTDEAALAKAIASNPPTFDFIDYGYIWHFTNVVKIRRVVMEEVWRRICGHYPGTGVDTSDAMSARQIVV